MERFAAEAIERDRNDAIKASLDAKVPLYDVMKRFHLSEGEIAKIIMADNQQPKRDDPDAIRDARAEPPRLIRGRR